MVLSDDPGISGLGLGQALLVKGMEAQKAGRNEEALKLAQAPVDRYPQASEARYYRALALNGLGRNKEALEDVDKALCRYSGQCRAFSWPKGIIPAGPGPASGGHIDLCPGHEL